MQPSFIHLRLHSEFSLVDGIVRIKPLIKRLIDLNMPAVALTEHANLFSLVKFYKAALSSGIKAIAGADVLIANPDEANLPFRLTLLANNKQGYVSLTELISRAYQHGQVQGVPLLQADWIAQNNQGLIALSGAMEGDIGQALLADKIDLARQRAQQWASVFDNRFYLEIQRVGKENEERYLAAAVLLALELDLPVVATNDVRFLAAKDFAAHEVRVCINQGRILDDARRPKNYTPQQYLRSAEEMQALFADLPEALANSVEIAKRCNLALTLGQNYLPVFPVPNPAQTSEAYFSEQAHFGLEQRLQTLDLTKKNKTVAQTRQLYFDRLEFELNTILQMGFAGYFLIVADFIQWAKNNQIPVGPGRGSGAGSLVAYALKITDLDPIEFDLLFERFLNPERVSMPDFDIDFCMERRDEVIDYVARRYGRERVSQIITYGSMAAKAVIRDVGRVLNHGYGFVDRLAKLIPFELGMTLEKALKVSRELKQLYDTDEEVKPLIDMALSLEGITRNAGKHAGGVVIAPTKLTDFTPLYCDEEGHNLVTQFDKDDVEAVGLVKFDFLGLRTLTIIDWALQTINQQHRTKGLPAVDISQIPLDDLDSYRLLQQAQTTAVFQLESAGMKKLIEKLKPDCFDDIIALVALFRPGPLESGMVDAYVEVKHKRQAAEYAHPLLEPILKPTNGVILYQEQVMQIAREMALYSLGGADILRRCLSGSTQVVDVATGQCVTLQEIADNSATWIGRQVFSLDLNTQKIVARPISAIYPNGQREVWEITTKTQRKIRATADHLFYTVLGWQSLEQFKVGDSIALAKQLPISHSSTISDAQIKLTAYLIGDGHLSTKSPSNSYFCNSNLTLIEDFNQCAVELFGKPAPVDYQHHDNKKTVAYARIGFISQFNQWIDKHIKRAHSRDKEIPDWVFTLSQKQLQLFLGILWSTDGSFSISSGHTDYNSTSQTLIFQIQHLLLRLGIVALFDTKKIRYKDLPYYSYRVQITSKNDNILFYERIAPYLSQEKRLKAEACYQVIKNRVVTQSKHLIPSDVIYLIHAAKKASGMTWRAIDLAVGSKSGYMSGGINFQTASRKLARHRVHHFGMAFKNQALINIANSEIFWDEIVSIEYIGEEEVFDLTIPETHNFIANDFIAHNCMGKKKPDEMAKERDKFLSGSVNNQVDQAIATYVFDLMEKFAGYGFNKSHSAAYALVAYQTAWLKTHYPAQFMAAVLSSDMDNTDKIVALIDECRQMKLTICPPDINRCDYRFTVNDKNEIVYGMGAIKGAGEAAIVDLMAERTENGAFLGLYDLCKRVAQRKVNRRVLEALLKVGCLDALDDNRAAHLAELPTALKVAEQHGKSAQTGQNDFFSFAEEPAAQPTEPVYSTTTLPWTVAERLEAEKSVLGFYLSGHPLESYTAELSQFISNKINSLLSEAEKNRSKLEVKIAGLLVDSKHQADKNRCFLTLADDTGKIDVGIFSEIYGQYRPLLNKDALLIVEGTLEKNAFSGLMRLTARKLYTLEQAREQAAQAIEFEWDSRQTLDTKSFFQTLRDILTPFKGGRCPLMIRYISNQASAQLKLGNDWKVKPSEDLLNALRRFQAISAVAIKYK